MPDLCTERMAAAACPHQAEVGSLAADLRHPPEELRTVPEGRDGECYALGPPPSTPCCPIWGTEGAFFANLDAELQLRNEEFDKAFDEDETPDGMHNFLVNTVRDSCEGVYHFAHPLQRSPAVFEDTTDMAKDKKRLLEERRSLRDMLHDDIEREHGIVAGTWEMEAHQAKLEHIQWKLTRLSNSMRRLSDR